MRFMCWCHPKRCHTHTIATTVNAMVSKLQIDQTTFMNYSLLNTERETLSRASDRTTAGTFVGASKQLSIEGSQTTAGGLTNAQNQLSSPRSQTTAEILKNEKNIVEVTSKGLLTTDKTTHSMVDSCDEMAAFKVLSSAHEKDTVEEENSTVKRCALQLAMC